MKPLNPDPCRITLRWHAGKDERLPQIGDYLISATTGYLIQEAKVTALATHFNIRIVALRVRIPDVPADAILHAMRWDSRGKKR